MDSASSFNSQQGSSLESTQDYKYDSLRKDLQDIAHESHPAKNPSPTTSFHEDSAENYLLGYPRESINYHLPDYKKNTIMEAFFHMDLVILTHLNELNDKG